MWAELSFVGQSVRKRVVCPSKFMEPVIQENTRWGLVPNAMRSLEDGILKSTVVDGDVDPREPQAAIKLAGMKLLIPVSQVRMMSELLWSPSVRMVNKKYATMDMHGFELVVSYPTLKVLRNQVDLAIPAAERKYDEFVDMLFDDMEVAG
jgi:hypothetical protein